MQTIISSPRFNSDGASRSIVAFLQQSEFSEDEDFLIYYDYPIYSDWPAPGSEDTELGVSMEPEVDHGEAEVHTRVQA